MSRDSESTGYWRKKRTTELTTSTIIMGLIGGAAIAYFVARIIWS